MANLLKEVNMNPVKPGINAFLIALSPISSMALSAPDTASASPFSPASDSASSAAYQNATADNRPENNAAENSASGADGTEGFLGRIKNGRIDNPGVEFVRTGKRTRKSDASTSLKVYAPMEKVNRALTVAKAIPGSSLNDTQAAWIQTLLLAGKQQINTELAYSVKVGDHGNLESAITYRVHPDTATGKSDTVASVRYSTRF